MVCKQAQKIKGKGDNMLTKYQNTWLPCKLMLKHSILMHIIIFFSVYLSFYEKVIIILKCINLGLIMMN